MKNKIKKFTNNSKKESITILSKLIAAKTDNPPGNEILAVNIIKEFFQKNKIKYQIICNPKTKNRPNIIGYLGPDPKQGNKSNIPKKSKEKIKKILLVLHTDVVPAGDNWNTPPFKATIKNGKIYGRGTSDNKGPLGAALMTLKFLKQYESKLKHQILLACVSDEETGGTSNAGIEYLLEKKLITADFTIVPDIAGNMKILDIAEKGIINLKITALGKSAHGSTPDEGINAIILLTELIQKLKNYTLKHKSHKYLSKPTINFGTILGGDAANMVAAHCETILNIRYIPSQTKNKIIAEIKKISLPLEQKGKNGKFKFEVLADAKPHEINPKSKEVQIMLNLLNKELNIKASLNGISGATFAKWLNISGIPAIGWGFGNNNQAHIANEHIKEKEYHKFIEALTLICWKLSSE
ncbi:ArgE/DapE family deacylase [Candidatus Woesearchaeota archaeon]|jgi:succinyl-diaminopimelate desuccinylase|nr:ArgE/DapE family deacylase [Candidatus Woesearchaeota archaeon]